MQSTGLQRVGQTEQLSMHAVIKRSRKGKNNLGVRGTVGEGNGTPLQYSCLENPMDRAAW